jgi:hypothetical protein
MNEEPIINEADQSINFNIKEIKEIKSKMRKIKSARVKKAPRRNYASKNTYEIVVKDVSQNDFITIKFIMPRRENTNDDDLNEFERPGRIAAYANISLNQIMSSISTQESQSVQAFSEEGYFSQLPAIGSIKIKCSFDERQEEINLLDGLKSMDLSAFTSIETGAASQNLNHSVESIKSQYKVNLKNSVGGSSFRSGSSLKSGLKALKKKFEKKAISFDNLLKLDKN